MEYFWLYWTGYALVACVYGVKEWRLHLRFAPEVTCITPFTALFQGVLWPLIALIEFIVIPIELYFIDRFPDGFPSLHGCKERVQRWSKHKLF